jgi:PPM family protein phosphatase
MKTCSAWRAGSASDPGLERSINEDRVYADDARGIYVVADGLGGHAAGEKAAQMAVDILARELNPEPGQIEAQVRRAITIANNEIFTRGQSHDDWAGMACVLTLAVVRNDLATVGHVGDSRLYLVWNGTVRKVTSDHSPVGEQEDQGELTESEAMAHPRRNEIFRDVGSHLREIDEPDFIEVKSFPFQPAAALLLCSDGLSDALTSSQINAIVERYDGDPGHIADLLVEAANQAGGKDNISVVFIAGPEFLGVHSPAMAEARARHAVTRTRSTPSPWKARLIWLVWFAAGVVAGMFLRNVLAILRR